MEHSEPIVKSQDRPTDKKSDVNESALKEAVNLYTIPPDVLLTQPPSNLHSHLLRLILIPPTASQAGGLFPSDSIAADGLRAVIANSAYSPSTAGSPFHLIYDASPSDSLSKSFFLASLRPSKKTYAR